MFAVSSYHLFLIVYEIKNEKYKKKLKFDEKRELTPKWVMGFTSNIAGWVDLDMLHIFAIKI
jgi:hypothetical protein